MIYFLLLALWFQVEGYDSSFSKMIKRVYQEYHVSEGDWCDQLSAKVKEVTRKKGREVSFLELKKAGVDEDYLDAMAVEYCKIHPDAYIAVIWPTLDDSYEKLVYDILSEECIVAYQKRFTLKKNGPMALMLSIPEKVPFIPKDFRRYFERDQGLYPMRCFVIRARRHAVTLGTKQKLRKKVGIGRYSIHINDTHDQCMDLAFQLLNNNSIHFLNYHDFASFKGFDGLFGEFASFLQREGVPGKDICVGGSAVLAAYGMRDCGLDFDFICTKFGPFGQIYPLDHHNIESLIYNPKNFFYYRGVKFASIQTVRDFKESQGRMDDVQSINRLIGF